MERKFSLIISVLLVGVLTVIASCKKPDEVKIKEDKAYTLLQDDLARSMKKASLVIRWRESPCRNHDPSKIVGFPEVPDNSPGDGKPEAVDPAVPDSQSPGWKRHNPRHRW